MTRKAAQWPRVVAGVVIVVAVGVMPDFLFNPLWHHTEGDQMKWTDWLLVAVGVLQFGAIMGQVCIYRRQAGIMVRQLASMRLAGRTARRVADTTPRVERAYVVGGGGLRRAEDKRYFVLNAGNYGKTPAYLKGYSMFFCPPGQVPANPRYLDAVDQMTQFIDTLIPGEQRRDLQWVNVENMRDGTVVYGRFWYDDIFRERRYFSFILSIYSNGTLPDVTNVSDEYNRWT